MTGMISLGQSVSLGWGRERVMGLKGILVTLGPGLIGWTVGRDEKGGLVTLGQKGRGGCGFTGSWMRKGGGGGSLGRVKDGLVAQGGFTRTGEKDELVGLGRFHTDSRFHRAVSLGQGQDSRLVTLGWVRKGGVVALERARRHGWDWSDVGGGPDVKQVKDFI